jgi:hypothetical protein
MAAEAGKENFSLLFFLGGQLYSTVQYKTSTCAVTVAVRRGNNASQSRPSN